MGFLYSLIALRVVEWDRTERKSSASGLHPDAKDSTEALFDFVYTAIFARPAIVKDHVICAAVAVRERGTGLCFVVSRLLANISC